MPWSQESNPDCLGSMVVVSILATISLAWDSISICRNPVSLKIDGYTASSDDSAVATSATTLAVDMLTDPLRNMPKLLYLTTLLLKTL
jgi:hypothetical protein